MIRRGSEPVLGSCPEVAVVGAVVVVGDAELVGEELLLGRPDDWLRPLLEPELEWCDDELLELDPEPLLPNGS